MRIPLLVSMACVFIVLACGAARGSSDEPRVAAVPYGDYRDVLSKHVKNDGVDYTSLAADRSRLDRFVGWMALVDSSVIAKLPGKDELAFWINAYNALTLELVIDHYPLGSLKEVKGAWDEVEFTVSGRMLTLNAIEHEIIRKRFAEPRIHFALVCAARSCPPLRNEPYEGKKLDRQLEEQTRKFLRSQYGLLIDEAKGILYLTPLFQWYGGDFPGSGEAGAIEGYGGKEAAALSFILPRVDRTTRRRIEGRKWRIRYFDYDWALNDARRR